MHLRRIIVIGLWCSLLAITPVHGKRHANSSATIDGDNATDSADDADTGWPSSRVDTARDVSYLSGIEKDVVQEINKMRMNPALYAEKYLVPMREHFDGRVYHASETRRIQTQEGIAALEECIRVLRRTEPLPIMQPSRLLSLAARDHVADTGKKGLLGHAGSDGSTPQTRIERHGDWQVRFGENIAYGIPTARQIVIQLLIDDGVEDRGHRKNLLHADFRMVGMNVGHHATYDRMCVMTFAGGMAPDS